MIKLEHLRHFVEVVNHHSLAEAASALHRSPSAISMTLKQIEDNLKKPLFEGSYKKTLTPLGQCVYQEAVRAINQYDQSVEAIEYFSKGQVGNVSIAAVPSVAALWLPKIIKRLSLDFPSVYINLRDIDSTAVASAIKDGDADFGIASLSQACKGLKAQWLSQEPFIALMPKQHALARRKQTLNWDDLLGFPFIANPLIEQIDNPNIATLSSSATMHICNIASLVTFVREGFGITLLPRMAASLVPDLIAKPIAANNINRQLFLLQNADRSLSPVAKLFKDNICHMINNKIVE